MVLHCWVRPRRSGGYIAECLELGMYFVEADPGRGVEALREAIDSYGDAVKHFSAQHQPVRPSRVAGYWWKRPLWHAACSLGSVRKNLKAFSCEITLPALA